MPLQTLWQNPHVQTIAASKLRSVPVVTTSHETLELDDGDFLDLDWHRTDTHKLAILSHGLEGNSKRMYIQGLAAQLIQQGWDVLAWNCRGCSGRPNRLPRLYHCGSSLDLHQVVQSVGPQYTRIDMLGFSMGGNMTMLYLGRELEHVDPRITSFVAVSAPCDLADSVAQFETPIGAFYSQYFLKSLKQKILTKQQQFPNDPRFELTTRLRSLRQFDNTYTAPLHDFKDAQDYWATSSSRPWLSQIQVPGLILNAQDDPFLSAGCYPEQEVRELDHITLEMPLKGGHVGFLDTYTMSVTAAERRAVAFVQSIPDQTPKETP